MSITRISRGGGTSMPTSQATSEADAISIPPIMPLSVRFLERMQTLHSMLAGDLLACDAKWTLFVAAALSYRYDSLLRPFPPRFISEESGCNIDELVSVINDMPKLSVVLRCIAEQNYEECDMEVLELLHWVLIELHDPVLRPLNDVEYDELMYAHIGKCEQEQPTHVFEVCQTTPSQPHDTFFAQTGEKVVEFAYYGNKLDSFFSIISDGFVQYQCGANEYTGTPLLLKRQLADCLSQSPVGAGWGASCCGSMIACVAICEYLSPGNVIECNNGSLLDIDGGGSGDGAGGYDDTGDDVKDSSEVIIFNSDMVRVRYLLFYGSRFAEEEAPESDMLSWINRHKYSLSLAAYMLMLASIGVANSGSGQYIKHLLSRKANLVLEFCKRIFVSE